MKYFFILGRNLNLSRVEVFSYLDARGVEFSEDVFHENLLVLDLKEKFEFNIQEFGGVMKLGQISFFGKEKESADFLDKDDLVNSDKFSYAVFGNFEEGDDKLKKKFKSEKRKAMLRHGRKTIEFQEGQGVGVGEIGMPNADFYFFIYSDKNNIYFGVVEQEFDNSGVKNRDMNKPHRREELAISPRLSRILVNLSGVKKEERFFDCFCGVGGVLQEALISNINVVGVDKDKNAIKQAKENLAWIKKNFDFNAKYDLITGNSGKISVEEVGNVDGIGAESALGQILNSKPSKKEAEKFIKNFENFIIPVLKNLKNIIQPSKKIAMTFPVVSGFHVDILGILKSAGLQIFDKFADLGVKFPILESRKDQFVSRDFVVFIRR
tara:strand:+ start:2430 stop:3569 length:1140 start_codon:yes stop_codon:yes gene_type:complete